MKIESLKLNKSQSYLLWICIYFFKFYNYSSVELLLETLCLEGNRKQAKYSVQALAAITKDDGLKSLSVLYKVRF